MALPHVFMFVLLLCYGRVLCPNATSEGIRYSADLNQTCHLVELSMCSDSVVKNWGIDLLALIKSQT